MSTRLDDKERQVLMQELKDWTTVEGRDAIQKSFKFKNFNQAFGFMTRAALYSETMNHHPEWSNTYATVIVDLVTHSANGITKLDFDLAKKINAISDGIEAGAAS